MLSFYLLPLPLSIIFPMINIEYDFRGTHLDLFPGCSSGSLSFSKTYQGFPMQSARFGPRMCKKHRGACRKKVHPQTCTPSFWWSDGQETPGVKTEEIREGRILAGLRDIWRVCLNILPLYTNLRKSVENIGTYKTNLRKTTINYGFLMFQ